MLIMKLLVLRGNCPYISRAVCQKNIKIRLRRITPFLSKRGFSNVSRNTTHRKPPWRVLFFGTDTFSLPCLKMLYDELRDGGLVKRLGVVTSLKAKNNPVRDFAELTELTTFGWPSPSIPGDYDVGLVSSFGHLIPERIIDSFQLGMVNVHASLLPRWRGAAPIIYAILNGDTVTGVTIMQIKARRFDVGNIICQEQCPILSTDTSKTLKTRLAHIGCKLLIKTLKDLPGNLNNSIPQPEDGVTYAPRVTSSLAVVDWHNMGAVKVYNLHRALSGLYTLKTSWHGIPIKLFEPSLELDVCKQRTSNSWLLNTPGCVETDPTGNFLRVLCADNEWIGFKTIGVPGKRAMSPQDFYNGYISKRGVMEWSFS